MKKNEHKEKLEKVKELVRYIAQSTDVHPSEVKKSDVLFTGEVSEWDLRVLGGLDLIKKTYFPVDEKALVEIKRMKNDQSYVSKLEKELSQKLDLEQQSKEILSKLELPKELSKTIPKLKRKSKTLDRDVVVSLNDTHYGCLVNPEEVGNVNSYGWKEACRRTALIAEQVVEYKLEKRNQVNNLHVILNGDIIAGVIHDLAGRTADLLALQQNGAIHILVNFLNYVSKHYKNVIVYALSGNHDDMPHRREGGRVLSHKYDSAASPIFYALSAAFRNNKNISFKFTKGLSLDVVLPAGRMLVTHGDVLFSKQLGNPGSNINVKGLSDSINRFNSGELAKGSNPIKLVLFGHTHTHASFTTFDGIKVFIVPSLVGTDSYAYSLGINFNQASQLIFESTKKHIMGDSRLIEVTDADNRTDLDKIIPIYTRSLEWQP